MRKRLKAIANLVFLAFLILAVPKLHNHYLRALGDRYTTRLVGLLGGGTGFQVQLLPGKKYILTNSHVCDTNMDFGIPFLYADADNAIHRILYKSTKQDICLLEPLNKVGGLILGFDPHLGQEINVVGYPELMPLHLSKGEVMAKVHFEDRGLYQRDSFYVSNQVLPGNSGSPVLDSFGRVVGILWGGRRDIYWGLVAPVSDIRKVIGIYEAKKDKASKHRRLR